MENAELNKKIKIHNGTLDLLMTDLYISVNIIPDTKFQIPMICVTFSIEDFKNGLSIFDLAIKKGLEALSNSQKGRVAKQLCKDTELIIEKIMEITGENTIENILANKKSYCVSRKIIIKMNKNNFDKLREIINLMIKDSDVKDYNFMRLDKDNSDEEVIALEILCDENFYYTINMFCSEYNSYILNLAEIKASMILY